MRYVVVSIYDRAVAAYSRPAFVRSEGEAIRVFSDEVNRKAPDNPMHVHPEHFVLFFCGYFFDDSCKFQAPEGGHASELISADKVLAVG